MEYRGWKIEPIEATQVNHKTNAGTMAKVGLGTKRQISGYEAFYPDSDKSKIFNTLTAAKKYIDDYEGPANHSESFSESGHLSKSPGIRKDRI